MLTMASAVWRGLSPMPGHFCLGSAYGISHGNLLPIQLDSYLRASCNQVFPSFPLLACKVPRLEIWCVTPNLWSQ